MIHHSSRFPIALVALLALAAPTACSSNQPLLSNTSSAPAEAQGAPSFGQFSDIPIPDGAKMDLDRTLVFGGDDSWIGRLVFSGGYSQSGTFDFYKAEMPKFGWQEITTVRSANSVMAYQRGQRVATIQIAATSLGGSEVNITVSPKGGTVTGGDAISVVAPMAVSPGVDLPPPGGGPR